MEVFAIDVSGSDTRGGQSDRVGHTTVEPGFIQIGGASVYPSLKIVSRYDDNLFDSSTDELETAIGIVAPAVTVLFQDNIKTLKLDYHIEAATHEASSDDDYIDQKILGVFSYHPTTRLKLQLTTEFLDEHDPRGTARTEGNAGSLEPDEWHSYGIGGFASYGTSESKGRIELEANYVAKEYVNNRQFTFDRDRSDIDLRGTFYYRIRPNTRLLFETQRSIFDYDTTRLGTPALDSTEQSYLFGVAWNATYKTSGFAKFGISEKEFDSSFRENSEYFQWSMGLTWRPRSYSTVDIRTERRQDETNGIGDSIDVGIFSAKWNHEWRDHISSSLDFSFSEDDYQPTNREDTRFQSGIRLNYDWRRWARFSAGYKFEERDSNIDAFDYERNLLDFTLNFTL